MRRETLHIKDIKTFEDWYWDSDMPEYSQFSEYVQFRDYFHSIQKVSTSMIDK